MDKLIFRTTPCWAFSSKLDHELYSNPKAEYDSLKSLFDDKGPDYVIKNVFEDKLSYDQLCHEFEHFSQGGESRVFTYAIPLNKHFAVSIDSHIHLFYFYPRDLKTQRSVLKWNYAHAIKFAGDTWWYEDEEIVKDICKLSILAFLEKYKGYME